MSMILHGYWRSSASYRVRIALAMKGVQVRHNPVNLREAEQGGSDHIARNPQGYVPVLELEDGTMLRQSLAIMDFIDASFEGPELMPRDALLRSRILAASLVIASDIHPIQNLAVLKYLRAEYGADDTQVETWARHWMETGFASLEVLADPDTDFFCTDQPMFFECCLIPQVYNARRFGVDMDRFPRLREIDARCNARPEFIQAHPENQADAQG